MVISVLALVISAVAAFLAFWYDLETRKLRKQTTKLGEEQLTEARRSAEAAQRSATAAEQQLAQTKLASEASDRSAEAAESSAEAARESSRLAAEGMRISQRAYLGIEDISFQLNARPRANQIFSIGVILKNFGNSPALDVRIEDSYSLRPSVNRDLIYPDLKTKGIDIAPGATVHREYRPPQPLANEHANALNAGTLHLYAFGWARYKDIFQQEHATRWCYEYVPNSPTAFFTVPEYNNME